MSDIFEVSTNLSQVWRNLEHYGTTGLFKHYGEEVALVIWREFKILVKETAQYTGSTTMSWNLSMGGNQDTMIRELGPGDSPFARGHHTAVDIALDRNRNALKDISTKYRTTAIMIENYAPGIDTSENDPDGRLRSVNTGSVKAFARFQSRLENVDTGFSQFKDYDATGSFLSMMQGLGFSGGGGTIK